MTTEINDDVQRNRARKKGRGLRPDGTEDDDRYSGRGGVFDSLVDEGGLSGPARSIEGWIVFATGVQEESQEEEVHDYFAEFGEIKNLHLNLDRRTGFVKGYAFIEYESFDDAKRCIKELNGQEFLGRKLRCTWAFSKSSRK